MVQTTLATNQSRVINGYESTQASTNQCTSESSQPRLVVTKYVCPLICLSLIYYLNTNIDFCSNMPTMPTLPSSMATYYHQPSYGVGVQPQISVPINSMNPAMDPSIVCAMNMPPVIQPPPYELIASGSSTGVQNNETCSRQPAYNPNFASI